MTHDEVGLRKMEVEMVRTGIVGGGIRGRVFAEVVRQHPEGELVGFVEPNEATASSLRDQFQVPIFATTQELIEAGADAVVISTPDFAHLEPGLAALNAGAHVLFEKPLATTLDEARQLRDAAASSSGIVMVGFENRWNGKFQAVKAGLDAGRPAMIAQRVLLQDTEFVPRRMLSWSAKSSPGWFLFPHSLDMAMWLSGARPVEVFARGVKKILAPDGIDTYDRLTASFLMSDGSIVVLDSGWVLPEARPAVFEFRYEVEAQGEHYEIVIDDPGITRFTQNGAAFVGAPGADARGRLTGVNVEMMRDFLDLCAGEDFDYPGVETGYEVSVAIAALHHSLETNSNVRIEY